MKSRFGIGFVTFVSFLTQACAPSSSSESQAAFEQSSAKVDCECIPAAGKTSCSSSDGSMELSKGKIQLSAESEPAFQQAFGSQLQCVVPGVASEVQAAEFSCSCESSLCETRIPGQAVQYFMKGNESAIVRVAAAEKDTFLKVQSKGYQCSPVQSQIQSEDKTTAQPQISGVIVDPRGPFAGKVNEQSSSTQSPITQTAVQGQLPSGISCSSLAPQARQSTSLYKIEKCTEGSLLTSSDKNAPWVGKSGSEIERIRDSIINEDKNYFGGKTAGKPYACQCQKEGGCGSDQAYGTSMFMDVYGAFFFENSHWGRDGYCKRY